MTTASAQRRLGRVIRIATAAALLTASLLGLGVASSADNVATDTAADRVKIGKKLIFGFADSSGVNPFPGSATPEKLAALEAAAGGQIARLTIRWERVEPNPPGTYPYAGHVYDWSPYLGQIKAFRANGIGTVAVIVDAPQWANNPSQSCRLPDSICPPERAHFKDFALFAAALADRFDRRGLAAVEVWNEPNLELLWNTRKGPDPKQYAEMFARVRYSIRKDHPALPVIVGGLTTPPFNKDTQFDMPMGPYLKQFYKALPKNVLDPAVGVAFHAYPGYKTGGDDSEGNKLFDRALKQVVSVTRRYDRARPLWATELGQSTTDPRGEKPPSERRQAQTILRMIAKVDAQPRAVAAMIYTVVERPPGNGQTGFGVVKRGPLFKPKRAYCKIAKLQKMPRPAGC